MDLQLLWSRLAGGVDTYVSNYVLKGNKYGIQPTYKVDYVIEKVEELYTTNNIKEYWVIQVDICRNINDLPEHIKRVVVQYLPRFFAEFPQYRDADCLKVKNER